MNFKNFLSTILLLLFFIIAFPNTACAKSIVGTQEISKVFPDHAVAKTIAKILGKQSPDELVSQYELNSIINFCHEGCRNTSDKILDISGVQYLNNLNNFSVIGGEIFDLSSLSELTNLRSLSVTYNKIVDISPLSNLSNITYLNLSCNSINSLNTISKLTKLEYLSVANNRIVDISPLESLENLVALDVSQNLISNLSSLKSLKNLVELDASFNLFDEHDALLQLKCPIFKCHNVDTNKKSIFAKLFGWMAGKSI